MSQEKWEACSAVLLVRIILCFQFLGAPGSLESWAEFLPVKQESSANKSWQFFALSWINCFHPPFCSSSTFSLHDLRDEIKWHLWCYFLEFLLFLEQVKKTPKNRSLAVLGWFPLLWDTWKAQRVPDVDFSPFFGFCFCVYLPSSIYSSGNSS